jgi:hypothetical protein
MKSIICLAQRARVSCKNITREVFLDSILPVAVVLMALLLTIGLAIPVINDLGTPVACNDARGIPAVVVDR